MAQDLFISGGAVLRSNGTLAPGDVIVRNGLIEAIGTGLSAPAGTEVLDATDCIVAPGYINAHYHSGENFNPGLYENLPLDVWFVHSHQVTRDAPPSRDAIYVRTLLGAMLMLRSGTTSCVDFLFEAPEITLETLEPVVQAYRDIGMRATILLGVNDKPFTQSLPLDGAEELAAREAPAPSLDRIMELARAAVDRWHEPGGLIGIGLGPSAPQRCTPELMDATMELARERGLAWQTHVLETRSQAYTCREWHDGRTFVDVLRDRGLLGDPATLVHTVWLTDDDIQTMADTGTTAVHCLISNMRLGDGYARLPALLRAGVRVALGTDGRGCDETLDLLELTRMTALAHKPRAGDYRRWPKAADAHHMATAAGSVCMGHGERLGRLQEGCRADLVVLDQTGPAFTPLNDPVRQLVYGATPREVRAVVVDGRVVVRDGDVVGVDAADVLRRAHELAPEVLSGERHADAAALEQAVSDMLAHIEATPLEIEAYLRS